jgi:hypothetical protein
MPNIYLVGLLNLAPSRRRVLENRNVTPIDLSPLFPSERGPDRDIRHERAIEWFLHSLFTWRPYDILDWPAVQRDLVPAPHPDISPLIPTRHTLPQTGPAHSTHPGTVDADELRRISSMWLDERKRYPGWAVLPVDRKGTLRANTDDWILHVFNNTDKLSAADTLFLLAELMWRMQLCPFPLDKIFATTVIDLLARFDPFPHIVGRPPISTAAIAVPQFRPTDHEARQWDWSGIQEVWVGLALWVLQAARLRYDLEAASRIRAALHPVIDERPDWHARFLFEFALCDLFEFTPADAEKVLEEWPSEEFSPRMGLPRASVSFALRLHSRARLEVQTALEAVRDQMLPGRDDIMLLSLEAWALEILSSPNPDRLDLAWWEQSKTFQVRLSKLEA